MFIRPEYSILVAKTEENLSRSISKQSGEVIIRMNLRYTRCISVDWIVLSHDMVQSRFYEHGNEPHIYIPYFLYRLISTAEHITGYETL